MRVLSLFVAALSIACASSHDDPPNDAASTRDTARPADPAIDSGVIFLQDSTGLRVALSCGASGCDPVDPGPGDFAVACGGARTPVNRLAESRLVALCATCEDGTGWSAFAGFCRPIVCTYDDECSRLDTVVPSDPAVCLDGLCQHLGRPISLADVVGLCLADAPHSTSYDEVTNGMLDDAYIHATQLADQTCGGDAGMCTVPSSCHAP